jgi:hypothetical protein
MTKHIHHIDDIALMHSAVRAPIEHRLRRLLPARCTGDSGAVSLEQVLWFVASGVSVAVVAGVLWGRIRTQANLPIQAPSAP